MYIIACIKNDIIYSKQNFLTVDYKEAEARLEKLKENGDSYSRIYQIMHLEEMS